MQDLIVLFYPVLLCMKGQLRMTGLSPSAYSNCLSLSLPNLLDACFSGPFLKLIKKILLMPIKVVQPFSGYELLSIFC